jgi:hypothetical protein
MCQYMTVILVGLILWAVAILQQFPMDRQPQPEVSISVALVAGLFFMMHIPGFRAEHSWSALRSGAIANKTIHKDFRFFQSILHMASVCL